MPKTAVDLLIFDLDGTLIESKYDIARSVNLTLAELGIPEKPQDEIFSYVGDGVKLLLRRSVGEDNLERYQEALRIFRGHYLEHCLDCTKFYPGIDRVLEHFQHKPKAIATNKSLEYTKKIMAGLGAHHFVYMVGGDDGFGLKPEPGMIHRVLEHVNVKPDRAVLIGDSTNDINAAHNAGIRVCAVGYGMGNREKMKACGPDWFIEKPEALMELFV